MIDPAPISGDDISVSIAHKQILRAVSLGAGDARVVGLLGPNGSGKSTLIRCLFGVLAPTSGQVLLGDTPLADLSTKQIAQQIAVVLQDMPADFPLTVGQIVALGRAPHQGLVQRESAQDRRLVAAALELCELTDLAGELFTSLSGGERQRALIARALVQQPRVLLMDEPTNHLDLHHQLEMLATIRDLTVTAVIALHDLNLAARYCDQIVLLSGGEVVAAGTPTEVLTVERIKEVYRVDCAIIDHPTTGTPHVVPL